MTDYLKLADEAALPIGTPVFYWDTPGTVHDFDPHCRIWGHARYTFRDLYGSQWQCSRHELHQRKAP